METTVYTPNFNDPRTKKRTQQALEFATKYLRTEKASYLSTRWLHNKDHFGKANNPLSDYLKRVLLICVNNHYSKERGICKQYKLNSLGVSFLKEKLDNSTEMNWFEYFNTYSNHTHIHYSVLQVKEEHADALLAQHANELETGEFEMDSKSNREFHPIQNIPSFIRAVKMAQAGYKYNYDIQSCAPTLILQHAKMNGLTEETPVIDYLLANRKEFRLAIASSCQITEKQTKQIINGLFQGAVISHYAHTRILKDTLNGNHNQINLLQQEPLIQQLTKEIKLCWGYIAKTMTRSMRTDKNGRVSKKPISGREKCAKYRELEEEIRKVIVRYLKKTKNKTFTEHDGWKCERVIDLVELRSLVKSITGYLIEIEYECALTL